MNLRALRLAQLLAGMDTTVCPWQELGARPTYLRQQPRSTTHRLLAERIAECVRAPEHRSVAVRGKLPEAIYRAGDHTASRYPNEQKHSPRVQVDEAIRLGTTSRTHGHDPIQWTVSLS